ncbi:hypothetical protein CGLO_00408 [Colletotrichum gloeosporioides Cg-14]|uniref:Uncharacterized protein n=1 Tax=Colletotrichum gloeosporioides (strain Cg-14) TaxID=1237896 RepID=T0M6X7_COLGC|nr:hypothetical protein CGLO_00408 [Colletotrichum gloeosporioides Cg-14]
MPNVRYPSALNNNTTLIINGHQEVVGSHPGETWAAEVVAGLELTDKHVSHLEEGLGLDKWAAGVIDRLELAGLEVSYKESTHQKEEDRQKDKDLEAVANGDIPAISISLHELGSMGDMRKLPPADTTTPVSVV